MKPHDPVNHPQHYTDHPSGVECIQITEHMNFNCGNAVKYIWRHEYKDDPIENLRKAAFYVNREIERLQKERAKVQFPGGPLTVDKLANVEARMAGLFDEQGRIMVHPTKIIVREALDKAARRVLAGNAKRRKPAPKKKKR